MEGKEPFPSSLSPVPPSPMGWGMTRVEGVAGKVDGDTHRGTGESSGSRGAGLSTFAL